MTLFPFNVGDRVRLNNWAPGSSVVIKQLGDEGFLYDSPDGEKYIGFDVKYRGERRVWSLADAPTYPEHYFLIYPSSASSGFSTNPRRWPKKTTSGVIGILHLHADGTTTMQQP